MHNPFMPEHWNPAADAAAAAAATAAWGLTAGWDQPPEAILIAGAPLFAFWCAFVLILTTRYVNIERGPHATAFLETRNHHVYAKLLTVRTATVCSIASILCLGAVFSSDPIQWAGIGFGIFAASFVLRYTIISAQVASAVVCDTNDRLLREQNVEKLHSELERLRSEPDGN